ncbi:MAG TPA: 50S ribosomal protein L28 [Bacillota bacterium]
MARRCEICGRGAATGNAISHSHRKTRRRWLPNLQRVRAAVNGGVRRLVVCTQCLRSGRVQRAW